MADDLLIQTADAVKNAIAAHDWGREFALARGYADVEAPLKDLDRLRVDVLVPEAWDDHALATQGDELYVATIEVAIRKRFGIPDQNNTTGEVLTSEMDSLVNFASDMARYFTADRFADIEAAWTETQVLLYSRAMLAEFRQFIAIIELTFEITIPRT